MRYRLIILFALVIVFSDFFNSTVIPSNLAIAQANRQWIKAYGTEGYERAHSAQQTDFGGYIVAGVVGTWFSDSDDVWVMKFDYRGMVEWQYAYGTDFNESANSIQRTRDGGYIVAGGASTSIYSYAWVLKLDSNGDIEWQNSYGTGEGKEYANSIQQTKDDGYIVAGSIRPSGAAGRDAWVLKLDSNGSIQWQKSYGAGPTMGRIEYANSIQQTKDDGYIVAGSTGAGAAGPNMWVFKLDSAGGIEWQKTYGGDGFDTARDIQQTWDGGYIVAGYSDPAGNGRNDIWAVKLDNAGAIEWHKTYGTEGWESARDIEQTRDGGYILAGDGYADDAFLLKFDSAGGLEWQKTYGGIGSDFLTSVHQTPGTYKYFAAGYTASYGVADYDVWLLKLDHEGDVHNCSSRLQFELTEVPNISGFRTENTNVTPLNTTVSPVQLPNVERRGTQASATGVCYYVEPTVAGQTFCEANPWHPLCTMCEQFPDGPLCDIEEEDQEYSRSLRSYIDEIRIKERFSGRFRRATSAEKGTSYLSNIYWAISPIGFTTRPRRAPKDSIDHVVELFEKAPTGVNYTEPMKSSLIKTMRNSKQVTPKTMNMLAKAINAMELDLRAPSMLSAKPQAGRYSAVDFQGIAWAAFRNLEKPGEISLRIKEGVPAFVRGFKPGWPISKYEFDFRGKLAENGYIDINFNINEVIFFGQPSDLRILEWNGKSYRDITTHVDFARGFITGRTNNLATYVIVGRASKSQSRRSPLNK